MTSREAELAQTRLLCRRALSLKYFTVAWCVGEVIVAFAAGVKAGSVALVAFGLDSAIEVVAAVAVLAMPLLGTSKRNLGTKLNSRVLIVDSAETLACAYFSAAPPLGLALNAWLR